jgi:alpha-1,3-glucosyltransferase
MTSTLPPSEWYFFELDYWGADYPPVCLFVHKLYGMVLSLLSFDPNLAELSLRGYEGAVGSMRLLNIFVEYCASVFVVRAYLPRKPVLQTLVLCMPLLPLVDHGHFQISNALSLSLTFLALHLITNTPRNTTMGCVCFMLSILMKQMALYFAPIFFFHLLSWALASPATPSQKIAKLLSLALPVIMTTVLSFAAFPPSQYLHIVQRIFPFHRGLFESKVSSLWCFLDTYPIDIRKRVSHGLLGKMCLLTTVAAISPACYKAFTLTRPTRSQLLVLLHQCALSFYLFSFHVHEKTILFPLAPLLLQVASDPVYIDLVYVALQVAICTCSCWFLFVLDGLESEMFAALLWWAGMCAWIIPLLLPSLRGLRGWRGSRGWRGWRGSRKSGWIYDMLSTSVPMVGLAAMFTLICLSHFIPPPSCLPDIYPVLVSAVGFVAFAAGWVKATIDTINL